MAMLDPSKGSGGPVPRKRRCSTLRCPLLAENSLSRLVFAQNWFRCPILSALTTLPMIRRMPLALDRFLPGGFELSSIYICSLYRYQKNSFKTTRRRKSSFFLAKSTTYRGCLSGIYSLLSGVYSLNVQTLLARAGELLAPGKGARIWPKKKFRLLIKHSATPNLPALIVKTIGLTVTISHLNA